MPASRRIVGAPPNPGAHGDAEQGRECLRSIIEADENSCRLGEVALVSKNTPIRQSKTLFFDTLYDENASCHLALGMGFPECVEGGLDVDKDGLLAMGVNQSSTHVDFMIGSDDLNIWGVGISSQVTVMWSPGIAISTLVPLESVSSWTSPVMSVVRK